MVSTCNAGAMAAPAEAVPNDPRTAGITHHQGSGIRGATNRSTGFSTCQNLSITCSCSRPSATIAVLAAFFGRTTIGSCGNAAWHESHVRRFRRPRRWHDLASDGR